MSDANPTCPFELMGDLVCCEFLPDKIHVHLPQTANQEELAGRFKVIGVGPGLPYDPKDPNSALNKPNFEVGDYLLFQKQNAYMMQDSGRLPNRFFAMLRAGQVIAKWKDLTPQPTVISKILGMA